MGDYTIRNLRDLEDAAVGFGLSPDLQARFARRPLECTKLGLSLQRLAPRARTPFGHRHSEQEEVYVVLDGWGRFKLGDDILDVRELDAVRIAPQTMRAVEAGPEGIEYLAIGAPATEGRDDESVKEWWSD